MSSVNQAKTQSKSVLTLREKKKSNEKISMVTCYDSAFAKIINRTDIDIVLVGDSLGNVMMGLENTVGVTMAAMIHHTRCVANSLDVPMLCADMPFLSYVDEYDAVVNAGRLLQEGGAESVKLEGGEPVAEIVLALTSRGVPVMGHLGLMPQSVHAQGGYRVQGKDALSRTKMIDDAKRLEDAGAFAIVLEMVPEDLAKEITNSLDVPVIGIGAGTHCDGQVLVLHDLLGFDPDFNPKFLKKYADLSTVIGQALKRYDEEVKQRKFPK